MDPELLRQLLAGMGLDPTRHFAQQDATAQPVDPELLRQLLAGMRPDHPTRHFAQQDATAQPGRSSSGRGRTILQLIRDIADAFGRNTLGRALTLGTMDPRLPETQEAYRGALGFAADFTPVVGDIKAATHDAPQLFGEGHPIAGTIAAASALPLFGIPLDVLRGLRKADEAATITARHYGPQVQHLDELDPSFHGTGRRGAERARKEAFPEEFVDPTYFYTGARMDNPEPGLRGLPFVDVEIPAETVAGPEEMARFGQQAAEQIRAEGRAPVDALVGSRARRLAREAGYEAVHDPERGVLERFVTTELPRGRANRLISEATARNIPGSNTGGATFTVDGEDLLGTPNYAVAVRPVNDRTVLATAEGGIARDDLNAFREDFAEDLADPDHHLGTWRRDPTPEEIESGFAKPGQQVVDLDVVRAIPKEGENARMEAIRMGIQNEQKAIFDLENIEEIQLAPRARRAQGFLDEQVQLPGQWYSPTLRSVYNAPQQKATGAQWEGMLRKAEGFTKAEREATGIDQFLAENADETLTADQVAEYIEANTPRLTETVHGTRLLREDIRVGEVYPIEGDEIEILERLPGGDFLVSSGDEPWIINESNIQPRATKYKTYTLPGGENYREVLIQHDPPSLSTEGWTAVREPDTQQIVVRQADGTFLSALTPGFTGTPEEAIRLVARNKSRRGEGLEGFRSPHWDEPNVLVHLRVDDRMVGGDRTYFIIEIQSDWHQRGRERGYAARRGPLDDATIAEIDRLDAVTRESLFTQEEMDRAMAIADNPNRTPEETAFYNEFMDRTHDPERAKIKELLPEGWEVRETTSRGRTYFAVYGLDGFLSTPRTSLAEALTVANEQARLGRGSFVPDAPFKRTDDWVALSFRRALQEAAEGGYDRVAWISGEQAADMYDLRRHVSRIEYDERGEFLHAFDHDGNPVIAQQAVTPEDLPDYIGKDPARRLMEADPIDDEAGLFREISGDDLVVGGEGMDTFYNRIVPNVVEKEAKRLGVEIEPVRVQQFVPGEPNLSIRLTPEAREKILNEGMRLGAADPAAVAGAAAAGGAVLGIPLILQRLQERRQTPETSERVDLSEIAPLSQFLELLGGAQAVRRSRENR